MDDKRTDRFEGKTGDRPDAPPTVSQTGHDTDGRSPDYDVSLRDGAEIVSDGVVQKPDKPI